VVISLERGVDCLHMVQLISLHPKTPSSLASFKSRLVLPFWHRLPQVILEKRPLNGCIIVVYSDYIVINYGTLFLINYVSFSFLLPVIYLYKWTETTEGGDVTECMVTIGSPFCRYNTT